MNIRKIALCGRHISVYDEHMLDGLAKGFHLLGIESVVVFQLLDSSSLASFCARHGIDTVLEINRTRNTLSDLPPNIAHICWLQDIAAGERAEPSKSELTYYLTEPTTIGYSHATAKSYAGLLFTGVNEEAPTGIQAPLFDFSVVGYIPPPITPAVLALPMFVGHPNPTIGEMAAAILARLRPDNDTVKLGDCHHDRIRSTIREVTTEVFGLPSTATIRFGDSLELFEQSLLRAYDRARLLDAALAVSQSLRIFGPAIVWHMWSQYSPYYVRFLDVQSDVFDVYRSTRINLHNNPNGFGMHSRVLDCMACGGVILNIESPYDRLPGGISTAFEPGVHYISCTLGDFPECARSWLQNEEGRRAMGAAARKAVLARHTWRHRAEQIVGDMAKFVRR